MNNKARFGLMMGMLSVMDNYPPSMRKQNYGIPQPNKDNTIIEKKKYGTKYVFDDGFECYALNQSNADRKHNNWLAIEKIK